MAATIKDVAAEAGVSTAVVSYVINNTRFVSPEKKAAVERAVKKLSYVPNRTARSFKKGRYNTIGLIVPDIVNPFFGSIVKEAEAVLSKYNYNLLVCNTSETKKKELSSIKLMTSGMTDGILLATTCESAKEFEKYLPENFPVVLIDRRPYDSEKYDVIEYNEDDLVREAVDDLVDRGHRKIGFIAGIKRLSTSRTRLESYKQAMKSHGIYEGGKYIRYSDVVLGSAYQCTESLINECTAIIVSSNMMTLDTLDCITKHNLVIGKDIEVIGWECMNYQLLEMSNMGIFTGDYHNLGKYGAERLLELIRGDSPERKEVNVSKEGKYISSRYVRSSVISE